MVEATSNKSSGRESVIVVMDANKNKGSMDALDWALKHVVRKRDTVIVLGVSSDHCGKKNSCFPLNAGISFSGIWERLEFSSQGQGETRPKELGEEIERKKEQYQNNLQPFYRQCKKNEVNMEVKLAFGFCPNEVTVKQAQNSNPRWIILASYLKKHKVMIYAQVGCNIAVMRGKDVATLTPSRAPSSSNYTETNSHTVTIHQQSDHQPGITSPLNEESSYAPAQTPAWYPLSWRSGFPRAFSQAELEEITHGFAEGNLIQDKDNIKIYAGIVQETPVLVKSFLENDERFWTMLKILSRVCHRNISNLVGYCCTGTSAFLLSDYPCLGSLEMNLLNDESARKLPWKARWYIAVEIGGSLRYLHEECVDGGAIVHLSVCSSHVVFSNGCSTMLGNFITARWLKDGSSSSEDSGAEANVEEDEGYSIDIHDYGTLLIELISGKSARLYPNESQGQSLIHWALPFLEKDLISEVLDPRLEESSDMRAVYHMVKAALLCLKSDIAHNKISMSEVLAVVRGDQLALAKC